MLEKILDNYYTRKLLNEIKWSFTAYRMDYKFINHKEEVEISVKPKEYSERYYKTIIHIQKENSFKYMCDLDKVLEHMSKIIREHIEKKGWRC